MHVSYLVIQCKDTSPLQCNLMLMHAQGAVTWQQDDVAISHLQATLAQQESSQAVQQAAQVVVLLPGEWVTMTKVSLPARIPKKNLAQIIGYALEDDLLGDPQDIHFVLLDAAAKPSASTVSNTASVMRDVAMINKAQLASVLTALQRQDINPSYVMPEYFALPVAEGKLETAAEAGSEASAQQWYASVMGDRVLLRTSLAQGYSVLLGQLPWFCRQLLQQEVTTADTTMLAETAASTMAPIQLHVSTTHAQLGCNWPEDLNQDIELQLQTACPQSACFDLGALQYPAVNLLQGEFMERSHKKSRSGKANWWRRSVLCVGGLVVAAFLSQAGRYIILSRENTIFLQQAKQKAAQFLPSSMQAQLNSMTNLSALRPRIQSMLKYMQQLKQHHRSIEQLISIDRGLQQNSGIKLLRLSYNKTIWNMAIGAPSLQLLQQQVAQFKRNGWDVTLPIPPQSGDRVSSQQLQAAFTASSAISTDGEVAGASDLSAAASSWAASNSISNHAANKVNISDTAAKSKFVAEIKLQKKR